MPVQPIPAGYTSLTPHLIVDGAAVHKPVALQFYGDRTGTFEDPFGHQWTVATHVEDVPPEEMGRRAKQQHG